MLSAFSFRRFTDDDDAATAAGAPHADEHLTYDVVRFNPRCDSLVALANNDDVPQALKKTAATCSLLRPMPTSID